MIKYIRTGLLLHDESFRPKAHQVCESKYNNAHYYPYRDFGGQNKIVYSQAF